MQIAAEYRRKERGYIISGKVVRKIDVKVPDGQLQEDLKRNRQQTIELGATDAKIISTNMTMEGVGMDMYTMAARAGWDVYPAGASVSPQDVPYGATYGLVLIY